MRSSAGPAPAAGARGNDRSSCSRRTDPQGPSCGADMKDEERLAKWLDDLSGSPPDVIPRAVIAHYEEIRSTLGPIAQASLDRLVYGDPS